MQSQLLATLTGGGIALLGIIIGAVVTHWLTSRRTREQRRFEEAGDRRKWLLDELREAAQSDAQEAKNILSQLRKGGIILQPPTRQGDVHKISREDLQAFCVPHNSMILMCDNTIKPVQDITPGEMILTYDSRKHVVRQEPVAEVIKGEATRFVRINGRIRVTEGQQVFCEGSYVAAEKLLLSQGVVSEQGKQLVVSSLELQEGITAEPVFSLVLQSGNGYYVRTEGADDSILIKEGDTGKND